MANPYGKRYGFNAAADYLEIPRTRLRMLVYAKRIVFSRTSPGKSGRYEFHLSDLDAWLAAQRVQVEPAPQRHVRDQRLADLMPPPHERVFG